ncbi:MAG: hypothetical protein ACRBDL_09255 [Alphaproteobacteria bacterium]
MSCNIPVRSGVKSASECKCYKAVMRAYDGLVEAGEPESVAIDAARIVYGYHHPEDSLADQTLTVERWVNDTHLH